MTNAVTLSDADVERMLDDAATASQFQELLRDGDGYETPLREAMRIYVLESAFAAGAASVQAVPREPTQEMCAAAADYADTLEEHAIMTYANIWRAMYDAAPTAQNQRAESVAATHGTDIGTQPNSAHPTPAPDAGEAERDDLVRRLYDMAKHDEKMVGYATLGGELYAQAAVRITADAVNLAALRLMVKDDAQWAQENERLTRERDELRERVKELDRADKFALAAVSGVQQLRLKIATLEANLHDYKENSAHFLARSEAAESRLAEAKKVIAKLVEFKVYTHQRLTELGAPHSVPSPHTDAGCRVGGRFDWVDADLAACREVIAAAKVVRKDYGSAMHAEGYKWLSPTMTAFDAALARLNADGGAHRQPTKEQT